MTVMRGISRGEYYHVFNRGAHKVAIFRNKSDSMRFLFLILYSQSPEVFKKVTRIVEQGTVTEGFPVDAEKEEKILKDRFVELVSFCLMPNHFHLLLRETTEGGIAKYMQRVQVAYTMFFNMKYPSSGHVFQGRYGIRQVKDDLQLMHLSTYIHRNPRELSAWRANEFRYPWSSLQDYTEANRWGGLLATDIIASRFDATPNSNYADFVKTSSAKMLEEEFGYSE